MLIGKGSRRPNREKIRNIKEALRTALNLPEETAITVTELTSLEEDYAPIETVVALLQPNAPPKQHKIHKSTDTVDTDYLIQISNSWDFDVHSNPFETFNNKIYMETQQKVPVTILTGFLGSGKTTLLNRIFSNNHDKHIPIINNKYVKIGIDQALVIDTKEKIFKMSNNSIFCTVRRDLIRVLVNLIKRRDNFKDVLVETTKLTNPCNGSTGLFLWMKR
jgi:Putative GTPases (G3E family)